MQRRTFLNRSIILFVGLVTKLAHAHPIHLVRPLNNKVNYQTGLKEFFARRCNEESVNGQDVPVKIEFVSSYSNWAHYESSRKQWQNRTEFENALQSLMNDGHLLAVSNTMDYKSSESTIFEFASYSSARTGYTKIVNSVIGKSVPQNVKFYVFVQENKPKLFSNRKFAFEFA